MRTADPRGEHRLLIVGGGPFQLDLIDTARRLGVTTLVVDGRADAPGLARADHPAVVDIVDGPAVVDAARRLGATAVVSAASDAALTGVSAVVDALGLPGPSSETVARCQDKLVAAETVRAAGLPCPETVLADGADPGAVGGFPLVVKPASAAGGRGVTLLDDPDGLDAAVERARRYGPRALLQRYVHGRSLGVEAFFWRGALVDAFLIDDQYARPFVSPVGHALPAAVSAGTAARVRAALQGWAAALGLTDGGVNFDLRLEGDTPVLIEVNPRLGGSSITPLIRAAWGADPSAAAIACALGESPAPHLERTRSAAAASRLFVARGRGRVRFDGDPVAPWRDACLGLTLDVSSGAPAPLTVDEWSLVGRCLVTGPDAPSAIATAADIAAALDAAITVEPGDRS